MTVGAVSFKIYKTFFKAVNSAVYVAVVAVFFVLAQMASSGSDYFVSQWANWEEGVANKSAVIERISQNATTTFTIASRDNGTTVDSIEAATVTAIAGNLSEASVNDSSILTTTLASVLASSLTSALESAANDSNATETIDEEAAIIAKREKFMLMYAIIMVAGTCVYIYRSFSFFRLCLRVSINMHDKLFRGITRARMIFFNNNPSGRILNRFSRDISNVDSLLPVVLIDVIDVSVSNCVFE